VKTIKKLAARAKKLPFDVFRRAERAAHYAPKVEIKRKISLMLVFAIILSMTLIAVPSFQAKEGEKTNTLIGTLGDADMDGQITVKDATKVQKHIAKILNLNAKERRLAGFLKKPGINIKCATFIQKYVAKVGLEGTDGVKIGQLLYNDYDTIFQTVNEIKQVYQDNAIYYPESIDVAPAPDVKDPAANEPGNKEYSSTNTQVSGIDESDIVKTDGNYIYTLSDNKLLIAKADNGKITKISETFLDYAYHEMYISGNTLVILELTYGGFMPCPDTSYSYNYYSYLYNKSKTTFHFYDVSDRANPLATNTLAQDGNYISSRMANNTLYLATNSRIYDLKSINENDPGTFVPKTYADGIETCMESCDIYMGTYVDSVNYVNFSSVDLSNTSEFYCTKSILGNGSEVYCNNDSFYVTASCYEYVNHTYSSSTQIFKYAINGPDIVMFAESKVNGNILNQFSMDEYNGYFRIVTQAYASGSIAETNLYVLDDELNLTGRLEGLAQNELIKSVRFDGDIGYFVTFRNTDPLFTVDLSDPTKPVILHELKIPGFSQYLHPFGNNLLLGFGSEADIDSGGVTGLKLSMFDVSDKTDVKEISTLVFAKNAGNNYVSSDAQYNHKAIFASSSKKLVGLMYSNYQYDNYQMSQKYYYVVFEYANNMFIEKAKIDLGSDAYSSRGFYIDDCFYIVYGKTIAAYSLADFKLIEKITF